MAIYYNFEKKRFIIPPESIKEIYIELENEGLVGRLVITCKDETGVKALVGKMDIFEKNKEFEKIIQGDENDNLNKR